MKKTDSEILKELVELLPRAIAAAKGQQDTYTERNMCEFLAFAQTTTELTGNRRKAALSTLRVLRTLPPV